MKTLHAKSSCCRVATIRFGKRRRQCVRCKTTWSIRKKRRGRKQKRISADFARKYLAHKIPPIHIFAKEKRISIRAAEVRLSKSRDLLLRSSRWPHIPGKCPLVAIADGMIQRTEYEWHVFYFILIRPLDNQEAIPIQPFVRKGGEALAGWEAAFNEIPLNARKRIVALVCDGRGALIALGRNHGWIIQRCHFHILAHIQAQCSKRRFGRTREQGQRIFTLVNTVLASRKKKEIAMCLKEIQEISEEVTSRELRTTLSGFVKNYQDFRSYLRFPHFHLPRTTNSVESLIGGIRSLYHRARGFRTLSSCTAWIHAYLKNKQRFTCNGSDQQKLGG